MGQGVSFPSFNIKGTLGCGFATSHDHLSGAYSLDNVKLGKQVGDCIEVVEDRKGQDTAYVIDSSKIRSELDWTTLINLDEGLDKAIAWVEEHYEELIHLPQEYIHKP